MEFSHQRLLTGRQVIISQTPTMQCYLLASAYYQRAIYLRVYIKQKDEGAHIMHINIDQRWWTSNVRRTPLFRSKHVHVHVNVQWMLKPTFLQSRGLAGLFIQVESNCQYKQNVLYSELLYLWRLKIILSNLLEARYGLSFIIPATVEYRISSSTLRIARMTVAPFRLYIQINYEIRRYHYRFES